MEGTPVGEAVGGVGVAVARARRESRRVEEMVGRCIFF